MKTKPRILPRIYFNRPTLTVARSLIGKYLVRAIDGRIFAGKIVEVEAYVGPEDKACHASKGRTQRTDVMFGPGGVAYVYLIYGMYWCFNAVTRERGHGAAVLVRAVHPLDGAEHMRRRRPKAKHDRELTNGPGKLCLAMGIVGAMSGTSLRNGPVVIRAGTALADAEVVVTPRIGITQAAEWPLRYFVRDDPFVSATPRAFVRTPYAP